MTYHNRIAGLAPARIITEEDFARELARIARRLLFSCPTLDVSEQQMLRDFARGETRYPMKTLRRFLAISSKSTDAGDRELFPELCRREILTHIPAMPLRAAFDLETTATTSAEMPQRLFEQNPNHSTREAVIESLTRQAVATRHAIHAAQAVALEGR